MRSDDIAIFRAIKAAGAVFVGPIVDSGNLWTIALALIVLNDTIGPVEALGIALIVFGPPLLLRRKDLPERTSGGFAPRYWEGVTFAIIASASFGTSPILIALAMPPESGLVDGFLAGLVSYCAAALVMMPILFIPQQRVAVGELDRQTAGWFTLSGMMIALSQNDPLHGVGDCTCQRCDPGFTVCDRFPHAVCLALEPQGRSADARMIAATLVCGAGVVLIGIGS